MNIHFDNKILSKVIILKKNKHMIAQDNLLNSTTKQSILSDYDKWMTNLYKKTLNSGVGVNYP